MKKLPTYPQISILSLELTDLELTGHRRRKRNHLCYRGKTNGSDAVVCVLTLSGRLSGSDSDSGLLVTAVAVDSVTGVSSSKPVWPGYRTNHAAA